MEFDYIECGDCLELMKQIPDGSVDLIVTSPPYNNWRNRRTQKSREDYWKRTNIIYGTYSDDLSDSEYENFQVEFLNECMRVLKDTGTMCYNHKDRITDFRLTSPLMWILKSSAIIRQRITWDRCGMQAYNPVRFYRCDEDIYILGKCAKGFKWNKECAKYMSVWRIPPSKNIHHPCSFPDEIPKRCIEAFTNEGDVVFDPFLGSGTTAVAAVNTGRHYIGFELDPTYYDIACQRLDEAEGKVTTSGAV
jgi:modification methylase